MALSGFLPTFPGRIACTSLAKLALALLNLAAVPAYSQCTTPVSIGVPHNGDENGTFFSNFVTTSPATSAYTIPISFNASTGLPGDLNAGYATLYYSIYNYLNSWVLPRIATVRSSLYWWAHFQTPGTSL